jgi:hypothetical protein
MAGGLRTSARSQVGAQHYVAQERNYIRGWQVTFGIRRVSVYLSRRVLRNAKIESSTIKEPMADEKNNFCGFGKVFLSKEQITFLRRLAR